MAKRRKPKTSNDWTVDRAGRWRDARGRFVSKSRLLDRIALARSSGEIQDFLNRAARKVPKGLKGRYIVQARFDGVGWRTLGNSRGLREALQHGADFIANEAPNRLASYIRIEIGKKRLRRGEAKEPAIVELEIRRLAPDQLEKRASGQWKRKRKKRKGTRK